jgi:hypothetical protein
MHILPLSFITTKPPITENALLMAAFVSIHEEYKNVLVNLAKLGRRFQNG